MKSLDLKRSPRRRPTQYLCHATMIYSRRDGSGRHGIQGSKETCYSTPNDIFSTRKTLSATRSMLREVFFVRSDPHSPLTDRYQIAATSQVPQKRKYKQSLSHFISTDENTSVCTYLHYQARVVPSLSSYIQVLRHPASLACNRPAWKTSINLRYSILLQFSSFHRCSHLNASFSSALLPIH